MVSGRWLEVLEIESPGFNAEKVRKFEQVKLLVVSDLYTLQIAFQSLGVPRHH